MTRLHVFDMDGTLLRGAATVEVSRYIGAFEAADAVERAWQGGEITDVGFWEAILPLWTGVTDTDIDAAFTAAAWIEGVPDVFADIAGRGEFIAVISQSPEFFVRRLQQWGAHRTFGSGIVPGCVPAEELLLSAQDKVDITAALLGELGLTEADCIAYGDSTSDIPLFGRLRYTVAVNPSQVLRDRAAVVYEGHDLREAYALGRGLVGHAPEHAPEPAPEPARAENRS